MKKNFLLYFIISLFYVTAHAFTLNNSAVLVFNKNEVKVNVAGGFCTNIGISDQEFLSIVGEAVDRYWNTSPTSRLKLRKGSIVSVSGIYYNGQPICQASTNCTPNPALAVSSDILVSCNDDAANFSSTAILGVTIPNNISGRTILGSLVLINDQSGNQFISKTHDEKVAIVAHELGHAFGLGHSPVQDSLMYYATVAQRKSLGADDIDGISYLYPKQQPFSGCGSIDLKNDDNHKGSGGDPNIFITLLLGFSSVGFFAGAIKWFRRYPANT